MQVLEGIKVVELGQLIAGPFAAKTLADFGARVIKVEPPKTGDALRKWRKLRDGTSVWWDAQSRNKESVCIDLRVPEGQALVRELVRDADVLIENFRPGSMEAWGLGWETLHALNPRLIMLSLSGFGQTGPRASEPGFAAVAEAFSGLRYLNAEPGRTPVRSGVSLGDTVAGVHGALGVMLALYARDARGGQGQRIDLALYEAMFNLSESLLPEYDVFGEVRRPAGGALPGITPSNAYACADGQAVLVAGNGDSIFKRLMLLIGRKDLADDPTLAANDGRSQRAAELDAAIGAWTVQHAAGRRARAHARRGRAREPRLHDRRDRRRRALRRARQHRAHPRDGRRHDRGAGHRAQAVGHAGRGAPRRAAAGPAHRRRCSRRPGSRPSASRALRKDGVIE